MQRLTSKLVDFLIGKRYWLLAAGVIMSCLAWPTAQRLDFDRSIENMFAANDPTLAPYQSLARTFGGNEVVLAVYHDDNLLNPDGTGISRLRKIAEELKSVNGVQDVLSLAQLNDALGPILALDLSRLLSGQKAPPNIAGDHPLAKQFRQLFEGYTHGQMGNVAVVVCMLQPRADAQAEREFTIDRLRQITQRQANGDIVGEPVMLVDGFRFVEADGSRLGISCTILMGLTIFICFRSIRWTLIPMAVVQLTLLMTQAAIASIGLQLSMVSSMLTAIVTVIATATIVHVIIRYRQFRSDQDSTAALRSALLMLVAPVFWACVTDAIGFAALLLADVGPVHDFGVMMVIGSLAVLFSLAFLLPALAICGDASSKPNKAWGERQLVRGLENLLGIIERQPKLVSCLACGLTLFAFAGIFRLEVETDFTKNFRSDSPMVKTYNIVENELGGAGAWDIVLPAPAKLDANYLDRVSRLQQRLRTEVPTRLAIDPSQLRVLSIADAVDASLPEILRTALAGRTVDAMRLQMPVFMDALHAPSKDTPANTTPQDLPAKTFRYRIMLRSPERQTAAQKTRLIATVNEIVSSEFPKGEVTGFFVLLARLIDSVTRDQWRTFGVAISGIGLAMLLAFRSIRFAAIAIVPNVLPVILVTGGVGWLGWKINMGAAMIAAVSLGLSIDSSIHYIISYQRARKRDQSVHDSLNQVQQNVGRAMTFSTLALIVGFGVLCFSQFIPTVYFGVLVSLTMIGGLIGNLVLLPLLIRVTSHEGKNKRT